MWQEMGYNSLTEPGGGICECFNNSRTDMSRIWLDKHDARGTGAITAELAHAGRQWEQRCVDSSLLGSDEQTPQSPGCADTHDWLATDTLILHTHAHMHVHSQTHARKRRWIILRKRFDKTGPYRAHTHTDDEVVACCCNCDRIKSGEKLKTYWRLQQFEEISVCVCVRVCACVGCAASIQHHHGVPLLFNVISSALPSD